jgi:membrane associated rhomboid family serine protease
MNFLNKLERKFGKYAIKNLMMYIVAMNAVVFIFTYMDKTYDLFFKLMLVPNLVLKGEVWRLVTYIFLPTVGTSIIWIIFVLYFYVMVGNGLEQEWGSFKFNIYYLVGMLGTTIAAFISGEGNTGLYLNMSLFLAFAYIYPNYEILIFFVLPIKVKYLGWFDAIWLLYTLIIGGISIKLAVLAAMLNFLLFFGKDLLMHLGSKKYIYSNKAKFASGKINISTKNYFHRCTVCGRTEKDDKNLEFRYCSGCEGRYEYCMEHLKQHEHIKKVIDVDFTKGK